MSKCWYCNEELTSATYCDAHIGICTKCYNSMFKVGNEFVKSLTDKISDLETKLTESEKAYTDLKELEQATTESLYASREYLDQLKSEKWALERQLAEKEKEILDVKNWWSYQYEGEKQRHNQDKISFAITELEKMRDWCIGVNENNKMYGFQKEPNLENCADIAQNRINELKQQLTHQHEDKGE